MKNTYLWQLLAVSALFVPPNPLQAAASQEVFLKVGEQKSIPVPKGTKFSIGNPEVLQIKSASLSRDKPLLMAKGKAEGFSDLLLIHEDATQQTLVFHIGMAQGTKHAKFSRKSAFTVSVPNGVRLEGGSILLGRVNSLKDWAQVVAVQNASGGKIQNSVILPPILRLHAEQKITKILRKAKLGDVQVAGLGERIVLKGNVESEKQKRLAEELAKDVFPSTLSQLEVPFEKAETLIFHAKILEMVKSNALDLGFEWNHSVPGLMTVGKLSSKLNFNVESALKIMEKQGHAKVLSQPEILVNENIIDKVGDDLLASDVEVLGILVDEGAIHGQLGNRLAIHGRGDGTCRRGGRRCRLRVLPGWKSRRRAILAHERGRDQKQHRHRQSVTQSHRHLFTP